MTQPHPGQVAADQLVREINAGTSAIATPVHTCQALPAALVSLADAINKTSGTSVYDLFQAVLKKTMVFRSTFAVKTPANDTARQQRVFRNMASGNGELAFDLTSLQLDAYLTDMFTGIAGNHAATKINERDLFHGHIVPNEANRDVAIIFHAKEYPDEEFGARGNMYQQLNLASPGLANFNLASPLMPERNFVWTLSTNKIFLITGAPYSGKSAAQFDLLMTSGGSSPSALSMAAKQAATIQEKNFGVELFTVNYFPSQLASGELFFTPVGQWGILHKFEVDFPKITPQIIAQTYASTQDSQPQTLALLQKM